MTEGELLQAVSEDLPYYGESGGVTFSGGEPLLQADFLSGMLDLCDASGIRCAIETSLYLYDERVLSRMQLVMADLKIWDDGLHKAYTGVSNERIKENFRRLDDLGVPILARTPIIPEIEQGVPEIAAFLRGLSNVEQYELLPYHPLGEGKRLALGLPETHFTVPTKDYMKELQRYVFIR
jgi:pyruvate formate lyase activating enzyme